MDSTAREMAIREARAARDRARGALEKLLAASADCEQHLREQSRPDALRQVTGHSSLDAAIGETRRMIETYDRILRDAEKGS